MDASLRTADLRSGVSRSPPRDTRLGGTGGVTGLFAATSSFDASAVFGASGVSHGSAPGAENRDLVLLKCREVIEQLHGEVEEEREKRRRLESGSTSGSR